MDKEEARFILRCFRPDGPDAGDPSFAEALRLAAEDRELGEWLARERARDAAFASAMARLELPANLRDEILAGLAVERGDLPAADPSDRPWIRGLATVEPPSGLREGILLAMDRSAPVAARGGRRRPVSWLGVPLAAAAGIALALVATRGPLEPARPEATGLAGGSVLPASNLEDSVIQILQSPDFRLDLKNPDHEALFRFIRGEGRACPQGCVPRGLAKVPGVGCRTVDIDGAEGAIVCFLRGENDVVHLAVFRRNDVSEPFPDPDHRVVQRHGKWQVACWEEKGRKFIAVGDDLEGVF